MNSPEHPFMDTIMNVLSSNPNIEIENICQVTEDSTNYPIVFAYSNSFDASKPTVFLNAGSHGDEPAGVYAIIRFLSEDLPQYTDDFNFVVSPCLNPSGFDAGTHDTASGMNINSVIGTESTDELIQAVEAKLKKLAPSICLAFDLHEDNSGVQRGCYTYEMISKNTNRIAHRVLEVLATSDICRLSKIYESTNNNGVIEDNLDKPQPYSGGMATFLKAQGAQHVMAIETPTEWALEKRIETHLAMIRRGLELI